MVTLLNHQKKKDKMLKVLVFVDFHNRYDLLPELERKVKIADIVVCAGDPTIFEQDLHRVLTTFNNWKKPVLIFHGNHESEAQLKKACKKYKNLDFFHGEERIIKGVRFLGWGGGGFAQHDVELDHALKKWKRNDDIPCVLVTHAPPYGTLLDDMGYSVGCKTVNKAIEKLKPQYAVSGHIHETEGVRDVLGETEILNPGPDGRLLKL